MPTMKEMAKEYRIASAKMAKRIRELKQDGADARVIVALEHTLTDMRTLQRLLDSYYELPRDPTFTCSNLKTANYERNDER